MFCQTWFPSGQNVSINKLVFWHTITSQRSWRRKKKKTALVFGKEKAFVLSVVYLLQSPIYLIFAVQWEFSSYAFGWKAKLRTNDQTIHYWCVCVNILNYFYIGLLIHGYQPWPLGKWWKGYLLMVVGLTYYKQVSFKDLVVFKLNLWTEKSSQNNLARC